MAKKIGDVMFPGGKYIKDGEEKTQWMKCGVLLQTDNGMRLKLDMLPINMGEGWFSVFEDKPAQAPAKPAMINPVVGTDDLPF